MISDEAAYRLEQDKKGALIRRICILVIAIIGIIVISILAFRSFKLYSEARRALREAKNIKMALEIADLEYYSVDMSIYDETADGNLRKGARDYVDRIQDNPEGFIRLTGYDSKQRKITGLEYELEKYIVRYTFIDDDEGWRVFQIKEIFDY